VEGGGEEACRKLSNAREKKEKERSGPSINSSFLLISAATPPARGVQILSAEYGVPGGFTAAPRPPLIPIMREKQRGPL